MVELTVDAFPCFKGQEIMASLFIAGGAEVVGRDGARIHVVGMGLMGLDEGTEFEFDMFVVVKGPACHEVAWRESR